MSTPAPAKKCDLLTNVHPYRVVKGQEIIGQFSNIRLAENTARDHRGTVVNMSTGKLVYDNGRLLTEGE